MRRKLTILLALGAGAPAPGSAQERAVLLLVVGADTIVREEFSRTPGRLTGELRSAAFGGRFAFEVTLATDGTPVSMTNAFWAGADPESAPPRQRTVLAFRGDSVLIEMPGAPAQRLGSAEGAMPMLNPSFALVELLLARAAVLGAERATLPLFLLQGGQTVSTTVTRHGADSALVTIGGIEARLRVDADQRILGGVVPGQGLAIVRTAPGTLPGPFTGPDYSAPAGAPYDAIEVRVPTPMGHQLAGTLTLPHGAGPTRRVPAVVTSTGSGPQERDEAIPGLPGYRPFRQLADTLSRHGIAVLRLDDRGQGGSGGAWAGATTADFADDIRAGLAWLRTHPAIDPSRLAIVGHSEGGIVAPMVAATDTTLRALVLIAAPAYPGRRVIQYQQRQAIDAMPNRSAAERDSLFRAAQVSLDSLARLDPWLRSYLDLEPVALAGALRRPAMLVLQGATDRQVTADQATAWDRALRAAGNRDVTTRIFEDANHLMLQDPAGDLSGYGTLPSRAVRADVLGTLLDWLRERLVP